MKQLLLLFLIGFLSFSVYAQIQGLPPCGIGYLLEGCDADGDGFTQFKLTDANNYLFCSRVEADYEPPKFYTDEARTNEIINYESYINIINPQTIYASAVYISTGETTILNPFDIEAKMLVYSVTRLTNCDDNQDGYAGFDLTSAISFCGANNPNDYSVTYYVSQEDANNRVNQIANTTNYISRTARIYMVIENNNTGDFQHNSFDLVVSTVSISSISNLLFCDDDYDGFVYVDLSSRDSEILNGIADSEVFYYQDAGFSIPIDKNTLYYTVTNPQTIYVKVENSFGCYDTSSFNINAIIPPTINQPTIYEVCDDISGDGVETFDLNSKNAEIIGSQTGVEISYHLTQSDAENRVNQLKLTFTNYTNPQTIYVNVIDDSTGCSAITTLDLHVKDCSNSGVIQVNAFYDEDSNGNFENNENLFQNGIFTYEKNNDGIQHVVSSSTGSFEIISDDDNNTYDISYSLYDAYFGCNNVTTPLYKNISATNGNTEVYNFPITKIQDCGDVAIYLVTYESPRPGFDYYNRLIIKNKGLETVASGTINFTHDSSITLKNVSNVNAGYTVTNTATGFTLNFVDLQPNQQEVVLIKMNVPVPTPLGTLLTNTATYSVTDLSEENNTSTLSEIVIGSYDPNDILESHGPKIFYDDFTTDDYLFYTVRFQNVGTADAINVSIDNTLDTRLDASTIQMLNSSHNNVFTRTDNQLNWQFDNIHLPSEDMDEPNSHGYVYYKIKPLAGYKVGDIIPNTAEIYFDFNPAVITNTFQTEFVATLSNDKINDSQFSIYPNPADNFVELKFNKNLGKNAVITIYDIQGKMILNSENQLQNNTVQFNVSSLKSGLYFLKVNNGLLEETRKLIIK